MVMIGFMNKKVILICVLTLICVCFAACGKNKDDDSKTGSKVEESTVDNKEDESEDIADKGDLTSNAVETTDESKKPSTSDTSLEQDAVEETKEDETSKDTTEETQQPQEPPSTTPREEGWTAYY